MFDSSPITSSNKSSYGNSQRYWGSGGTQFDTNTNTNGWYKVSGRIKGSGFKADAQYGKVVLLFNYSSNVGVTHYCGLKLYKSEQSVSKLRFHGTGDGNSTYVHNLTDQRYPSIEGDANTLAVLVVKHKNHTKAKNAVIGNKVQKGSDIYFFELTL